jgi:hypothetical protein
LSTVGGTITSQKVLIVFPVATREPGAPMDSPCIKICEIDQVSRVCRGCFRSLNEIAAWASISDRDRRRIMAELPARRLALRQTR